MWWNFSQQTRSNLSSDSECYLTHLGRKAGWTLSCINFISSDNCRRKTSGKRHISENLSKSFTSLLSKDNRGSLQKLLSFRYQKPRLLHVMIQNHYDDASTLLSWNLQNTAWYWKMFRDSEVWFGWMWKNGYEGNYSFLDAVWFGFW